MMTGINAKLQSFLQMSFALKLLSYVYFTGLISCSDRLRVNAHSCFSLLLTFLHDLFQELLGIFLRFDVY